MTPITLSLNRRLFGTNILMAIGAAVILLAITVGAFVFGEQVGVDSTSALRAAAADRSLGNLLEVLLDAETGQRGFLLTQDQAYLQPFLDARARFAAVADTFRTATADRPALTDQMDYSELLRLAEQKMAELDRTVALAQKGDLAAALEIVRGGLGHQLMDKIRAFSASLHDVTSSERVRYVSEMRSSTRSFTLFTTLGVIVVVVISIISIRLVSLNTQALETARIALATANEDLETRVSERTQGLARANDEIQRYAYIVSHDLRAPLVNIIGFTSEMSTATAVLRDFFAHVELDKSDPFVAQAIVAASEDIPEALDFIRSSSTRMDSLINEILKLSRLGRVTLTPSRIDIAEVLADCLTSLQHRLDSEGASASIVLPMPLIVSDVSTLQQIFGNLLDNAVKYFDASRPGRIVVRGKRMGALATFEVEDNGRGIVPSDHERVFELFRRSGVQDRPGEGIGLAHVRTLVRRLGGDISVESDGKSGTTFRLTIAADLRQHLRSQDT